MRRGRAFIQSYAVDKRLRPRDLRYERIDVVTGAVMTGIIAVFVVVACAETLHRGGISIDTAGDAARALEPLAGAAASDLPIVPLLYLGQALNAILLLAILPFIRSLAMDPALMGEHRLGPLARVATAATIALVAASVIVLAWLTIG